MSDSGSEEEVDEATQALYTALIEKFQDLCRRLKQHDPKYCALAGLPEPQPAPLELAEEFEVLAIEVLALGADQDDYDMCVHFAREIRKDFAEAEEREQRLQGHMDAERAKAEKELAQKRRDEEEKAKEEASANGSAVPVPVALSARAASNAAHMQHDSVLGNPPPSQWTDSLQAGTGAAFDLLALPEDSLHHILLALWFRDIGRLACTCTAFKELLAHDESVWRGVQLRGRRHPATPVDGSWHRAFMTSLVLDAGWRHRQYKATVISHHSSYISCTHLRGDLVLTGSGDCSLSVVRSVLRSKRLSDEGSAATLPSGAARGAHARSGASGGGGSDDGPQPGVIGTLNGHTHAVTKCQLLDEARTLSVSSEGELRLWDIRGITERGVAQAQASGVAGRAACTWLAHLTDPMLRSPTFAAANTSHSAGSLLLACGGTPSAYEESSVYGACVLEADAAGTLVPLAALNTGGAAVYDVQWWGSAATMGGGGAAAAGRVFAACTDSRVRMFDLRLCGLGREHGDSIQACSHGAVRCLQVEDNFMCCGSADGYLRAYDLRRAAEPLAVVRAHTDCVNSLALDLRLGWMVSGGDDCNVACVRVPSMTVEACARFQVGVLAVSLDHSRIVAGCEDAPLRILDFDVDHATFFDVESFRNALSMIESKGVHAGGSGSMLPAERQTLE